MDEHDRTSLGIDADLLCMLCYAAGPFSGGIILLLEKKDNLVRFHALQSCFAFLPAAILFPVFFFVRISDNPATRFIVYSLVGVLCLITILMMAWIIPAAWRLERKRFPIVGRLVNRWIPDDGNADSLDLLK